MKRLMLFIAISAMCTATASATQFGIRAGYYGNDVKKGFGGAELVFPFGSLALNPSIDYTKSSGVGLWWGSADVQYMFHPGGGPTYWVGAGPTYFLETYSGSGESNEHEWGWDANAGLVWRSGGLSPYVTVRYEKIKDLKASGVAVGLRFGR